MDDEHAYEGGRSLGVSEGCAGADAADREAAAQVAHADDEADAEDTVGGELRVLPDGRGVEQPTRRLQFILEDDCYDNAVNGHGLAKDN